MIICINGHDYTLNEAQEHALFALFRAKIEAEYSKLEPSWRLTAKAVARGALGWIENRVKAESGLEASRAVRPPKKADPVPHLFDIGSRLLQEMLSHVVINCSTNDETNTLESLTARFTGPREGRDGRPLDPDGHIRQWEDDGLKVSG